MINYQIYLHLAWIVIAGCCNITKLICAVNKTFSFHLPVGHRSANVPFSPFVKFHVFHMYRLPLSARCSFVISSHFLVIRCKFCHNRLSSGSSDERIGETLTLENHVCLSPAPLAALTNEELQRLFSPPSACSDSRSGCQNIVLYMT